MRKYTLIICLVLLFLSNVTSFAQSKYYYNPITDRPMHDKNLVFYLTAGQINFTKFDILPAAGVWYSYKNKLVLNADLQYYLWSTRNGLSPSSNYYDRPEKMKFEFIANYYPLVFKSKKAKDKVLRLKGFRGYVNFGFYTASSDYEAVYVPIHTYTSLGIRGGYINDIRTVYTNKSSLLLMDENNTIVQNYSTNSYYNSYTQSMEMGYQGLVVGISLMRASFLRANFMESDTRKNLGEKKYSQKYDLYFDFIFALDQVLYKKKQGIITDNSMLGYNNESYLMANPDVIKYNSVGYRLGIMNMSDKFLTMGAELALYPTTADNLPFDNFSINVKARFNLARFYIGPNIRRNDREININPLLKKPKLDE